MAQNKQKLKFRRIRGRIVPIREKQAAQELTRAVRAKDAATLGGLTAASLGGLFAAGRLERKSLSLGKLGNVRKSSVLNKAAKIAKFSAKFIPALGAATVLAGIDRRTTKDEQSKFFNIGNKQGAVNIGVAAVGGFAVARFGKRFEKFGLRGGKFPLKLRDI